MEFESIIKLFNVALAYSGLSKSSFARKKDIDTSYLHNVLAGRRKNKNVKKEVYDFTKSQLYDLYDELKLILEIEKP